MRRRWGIYIMVGMMTFSLFLLSPMAQEKKEGEEIYTIKQGDTLWDISARFLKNPFLWPKLWQRNPYITNPHWIYPGQPVRLSSLEEVKKEEPPKVVVEEKPKEVAKEPEVKKVVEPAPEKPAVVVVERKPEVEKPAVFPEIRSAGFFSDIEYRGIGIILESKEGKTLMSEGDICYLAFKTAEPVLIGDKYTVFRASELIVHPITGKRIGRRYNITGNIQIIDRYGTFYTAKVLEAFDSIEKGDFIRPYLKERMEVEKR